MIIFKNIRHYYYFCKPTYRFDDYDNLIYNKFWKPEEKFQFPKSVKLPPDAIVQYSILSRAAGS